MTKNLLLALPILLIVTIFYVGFTGNIESNMKHLFFLSITTFIIYAYQISKNESFTLGRKLYWYLLLFLIPSISATVYWFKYLNESNEKDQEN